ncbi:MAG: hypothetical protein ACR2PL_12505 [Dehalococcoidia bacterium]
MNVSRNLPPEGQVFPSEGVLYEHSNLSGEALLSQVVGQGGDLFCYIVTTVILNNGKLIQTGTGPNIEGGLVTLCTCKHYMRSGLDVDAWPGQWIAGFTSIKSVPNYRRGNYLSYLMRVERAYPSYAQLWLDEEVPEEPKSQKNASNNKFGDLYQLNRHDVRDDHRPKSYFTPRRDHDHCKNDDWHDDLDHLRKHPNFKRQPPLLVGDPQLSFLWNVPALYGRSDGFHRDKKFPMTQGNHHHGNSDIREFVASLGKG